MKAKKDFDTTGGLPALLVTTEAEQSLFASGWQ
jgi:hypothetical protein